ncbi:phosphoadenosine phosphosulfate reductase family protein [bacterium]|nr:phosphoadenosine phosphosulfate reductase family protein [bacterium]
MKESHILSLSGGKDSTALALYIKNNYPELHQKIEYVFYDTGCDLKETYDYLNKIEVFTNKKITYVKPPKSFDEILSINKVLPTIFRRWCTIELKIKPSNTFLRSYIEMNNLDKVNLYVGIRADEQYRKGVVLKTEFEKKYIQPRYPFIEDKIYKNDVEKILVDNAIGYPDYYKWRSRNGCFFCPFQTLYEWIQLYEHHPDLFKKAMNYEKMGDVGTKIKFRFNPIMPLDEIIKPENIARIKKQYFEKLQKNKKNVKCLKLIDKF